MTAPSPAGLSPLLDQLDEARERIAEWLFDSFFGDEAELPEGWLERKADALLAGPLAPLAAAIRAVLDLADEADRRVRESVPASGAEHLIAEGAHTVRVGDLRSALTAALTPGADTAGATA